MAVTGFGADPKFIGGQAKLVQWSAIPNGNTGAVFEPNEYYDMTVTVDGTFGVGGSVTFEGSNDGTNYYALTDPQGNAITKTAAGMEVCSEAPRYVRPNVTAGDGTTAIDVYLVARRGSR